MVVRRQKRQCRFFIKSCSDLYSDDLKRKLDWKEGGGRREEEGKVEGVRWRGRRWKVECGMWKVEGGRRRGRWKKKGGRRRGRWKVEGGRWRVEGGEEGERLKVEGGRREKRKEEGG
jgi:hypothetical protein